MLKLCWLPLVLTGIAAACDSDTPALLSVRLDTPLSSDVTKRYADLQATAIAPLERCGEIQIPVNSRVFGTVRRVRPVGLGVWRERAAIELSFHAYQPPGGKVYRMNAVLDSIDNAREHVGEHSVVQGILAAENDHRFLRGVWYRPTGLVPNAFAGLTGAGHVFGPPGAAGLLAARMILFRFPDPEIALPPGTEMHLRIASTSDDAPTFALLADSQIGEALARWLRGQPLEVLKSDRKPASDIINVAFIGSAEDLATAFEAAGWVTADPFTRQTYTRLYRAYMARRSYPTAPVSLLRYEGQSPDFTFQKSLNTVSQRHHIRIWRAGWFEGEQVWLGAGTHDTGIGFQGASAGFNHKIDPRIDIEREKVVDDLEFAGCSEPASYVDRPEALRVAGDAKEISTDGRLAVLDLVGCVAALETARPGARASDRAIHHFTRRFVLETRQYLLRDNVYNYGYLAAKYAIQSVVRNSIRAD